MHILLPLIPVLVVVMLAGLRVGILSSRKFLALTKELESKGHRVDSTQASALFKLWLKRPEQVVLAEDPEEVRAIKVAHASSFSKDVWLPKLIVKVGPLLAGVIIFVQVVMNS